jgi:hypothetical protein
LGFNQLLITATQRAAVRQWRYRIYISSARLALAILFVDMIRMTALFNIFQGSILPSSVATGSLSCVRLPLLPF